MCAEYNGTANRTPEGGRELKVFIAGTSFNSAYGGPAYSVSRLAAALSETGIEVGLWAPDGSAVDTPMLPDAGAVRRLSGSAEHALASFGTPDIIHDNGLWLSHNHKLSRVAHRGGIPRVVSTRGMLEPWARSHKGFRKRVAWASYQARDLKQASWIHATSEAEAENLARLGLGPPVHFIPNGVELPLNVDELRQRSSGTSRKALFLGRLYPIKGLPMLIEAWGMVRPEGWELQIAGPDEAGHLATLKQAVAASGLGSVVSFPGPVSGTSKATLLTQADLLVLPTHSESFGVVVGEALAAGLPVLTTTAAPWPALERESCGWRVTPDRESLAAGLHEATSLDRATLSEMGARGRRLIAARYKWTDVATQFAARYADTIQLRATSGR